jgi:hypothetical protein
VVVVFVVWLAELVDLFLNQHVNFGLDSLSEPEFAIKFCRIGATRFKSLKRYSLGKGFEKLIIGDVSSDKEAKDIQLLCMVVIAHRGIINIVEVFLFQFKDNLIEHNFVQLIHLQILSDEHWCETAVLLLLQHDVYLALIDCLP